jgi:NAD(P)-dependent dehydrogenase (short-subunit alcohol dehydrogenase family)
VLGTTAKDLVDARDEILRRGGNAMVLPADISQSEQLRTAVDALIQQWGRLDIVHANAGINGIWAPLEQMAVNLSCKAEQISTPPSGAWDAMHCWKSTSPAASHTTLR